MGKWFSVWLLTLLIIGLLPVWIGLASRYEGEWFPVVDELQIVRVVPETEDSALVWVTFTKLRDCEYLGVNFYDVSTNPRSRIRVDLKPGVPTDDTYDTLPPGPVQTGPWRVFMRPAHVEPYLSAILAHRCAPFYTTRTVWRLPLP